MLCANFGMAQKARPAVSSVNVRHVQSVMSCHTVVKKTHRRTWLAGSGANCAHGHNLLLQTDEHQGTNESGMPCTDEQHSRYQSKSEHGGKLSAPTITSFMETITKMCRKEDVNFECSRLVH